MATNSTYTQVGNHSELTRYKSADVVKTDDHLLEDFPVGMADVYFGVKFFAAGGAAATASAGSVLIEVASAANSPAFETVGTITAATPTTLAWTGNLQDIRVTPTGLLGFASWRVVVIMNWRR